LDLIVCWPRDCDYPLFRAFLQAERERFAKVIIVFTDHHGPDMSAFIRETTDAIFLDSHVGGGDWRDAAVNMALDVSDARFVWFTEQDFLITDPSRFWGQVINAPVIGWQEHDDRWHPSSLFVRRDIIDRTRRYFGPDPVDHFYAFGKELEALSPIVRLEGGFEHLQGTSQNHSLIARGEDEGIFKRDRFRRYLADSLEAQVPLHPGWVAEARREIERAQ
jgi:hypothetical protein